MFGWFKKKKTEPQPVGQKAGNDAVRATLAGMGDDGTAVRHVLHFAYPLEDRDPAPRDEIKTLLADADPDFQIKDSQQGDGVVFEHYREVASAQFDALTEALNEVMDAHGWDYDGWECAVDKKEEGGE